MSFTSDLEEITRLEGDFKEVTTKHKPRTVFKSEVVKRDNLKKPFKQLVVNVDEDNGTALVKSARGKIYPVT